MSDGDLTLGAGYEIVELTGETEFGPVYKARDVERDTIVAIRVRRDAPAVEAAGQRLVERLSAVPHDALIPYIGCVVGREGDTGVLCMVTEWVEGETLRQMLDAHGGCLTWIDAEARLTAMLDALMHACSCGVVHTALTPSHVTVTPDGKTRVSGFSMLGWHEDTPDQELPSPARFAPDYTAPEFLTDPGSEGDPVSEVFSFGVCMHEVLTGELPYLPPCGDSFEAFSTRWKEATPAGAPLKQSVLRVLINARKLLKQALSPAREQRFPSLEAVADVFRTVRCRVIEHEDEDEYELLDLIGRGGYGAVYKARRKSDERPVAFKYLALTAGVDRFKREAKILHSNPHPNLVEYVDFFATKSPTGDDQFFLVMELLSGMPGWTLSRRIKTSVRGLPVKELVRMFAGYLDGLQYLHDQGIIHRDIKPGNLYAPCDEALRAKLIDLGIARDMSGTQTVGLVPGTWDYMAPELFSQGADRGSPKSDMYALGLCLYEAATGQPAMPRLPKDDRQAAAELMRRFKRNQPVNYELPVFERVPWLADIIRKALLREPDKRFESAADMREALEEAARDMPALPEDEGDEELETLPYTPSDESASSSDQGRELPTSASEKTQTRGTGQEQSPPEPEPESAVALASPPKSGPLFTIAAAALLLAVAAYGLWYFVFRQPEPPVEPEVPEVPVKPDPDKPPPDQPPDVTPKPPDVTPQPPDTSREELDELIARVSAPVPQGLPAAKDLEKWSALLKEGRAALQEHPEEAALKTAVAKIEAFGREVPRRYADAFNRAMDRNDVEKARNLLAGWEPLVPRVVELGVDEARAGEDVPAMKERLEATGAFDKAVLALEGKLPNGQDVRLSDIPALNESFVALGRMGEQQWEGIDAATRDARLAAVRERLGGLVTNVLVSLRSTGTNVYLNGHDDSVLQQDIKTVSSPESAFKALAPQRVDAVVAELAAMREHRNAFSVAVAQLNRALRDVAGVKRQPARYEEVAARIDAAAKRTWPGVGAAEQAAKLGDIRASLSKLAEAELTAIGESADTLGGEGQPVTDLRAQLDAYRTKAPSIVAALTNVFETASQTVISWENRHQFKQDVDALQGRIDGLSAPAVTAESMQTVAKDLAGFRLKKHADVPPADVDMASTALTNQLARALEARVGKLADAVAAAYQAGEDAEPLRRDLLAWREQAPDAIALIRPFYDEVVARTKPPANEWATQVINALTAGKTAMDEPLRGNVDKDAVNRYLADAERVRQGLNVANLAVAGREAMKFQAAVNAFWNASSGLSDGDVNPLEDVTWEVIHTQLVAQVDETVGIKMMAMSPRRQTEIRRAVLGMVCRLETLTWRVSKCEADDPLRRGLEKYFRTPFYNPAIFEQGLVERVGMKRIKWLEELRKAKEEKGEGD